MLLGHKVSAILPNATIYMNTGLSEIFSQIITYCMGPLHEMTRISKSIEAKSKLMAKGYRILWWGEHNEMF